MKEERKSTDLSDLRGLRDLRGTRRLDAVCAILDFFFLLFFRYCTNQKHSVARR